MTLIEQLSQYLLKLKSEKAVSDNEVNLYATLISVFSEYETTVDKEFWTMLETQLQSAIERAKKPAIKLFD
jgi:site-specific recombinase XerC